MICSVFNGDKVVSVLYLEPVCGEDFCDGCGDCLVCHQEDICYGQGDGGHYWVKYLDELTDEQKALLDISTQVT